MLGINVVSRFEQGGKRVTYGLPSIGPADVLPMTSFSCARNKFFKYDVHFTFFRQLLGRL